MARLATTPFLNRLKSLYPLRQSAPQESIHSNPWYIIAAVAFSGSNRPDEVPHVFRHVLQDLWNNHQQARTVDSRARSQNLLLARKMRDAIFKSGLTTGYPRAINSLIALHDVMPAELRDTKRMRDTQTTIQEHERRGREMFLSMYGDTAGPVQGLLDSIYPDMGWFSNTIGYGLTYGFTPILSPLETSYTLVAALIAGDTPRQIAWHLGNAQRNGATLEEVRAVRTIAMEVAEACGVKWKEGVPEVVSQ
ncbi:hypothetical protein JAAARDRAFT_33236 [Jaapia argillacea MUCL 33604]|uniref:Carboxymuconolactone decarboxylase-like domain-containing protein n=1 Tax=Jaapia argillacea MUCL 33604 TaxID=933084 RepID=A0A067Q845_9AGAM|nr:hypothetical protein JAAARDRAFT_33236 [Jaapia argillacea MUCL 33604]